MSARHRRPAPPRKLDGRLGRGVIGAGAAGLTAVFAVAPFAHAAPSDPSSSSAPSAPGSGDGSSAAPSAPGLPSVPVSSAPSSPSVPSAPVSLGRGSSSSAPSAPPTSGSSRTTHNAKVVAPKATLQPDFGNTKLRVDVDIKTGAYVPAGTTTTGSVFTFAESDGTTQTCTTTSDGPNSTASGCFYSPDNADDSVTVTQTSAPAGLTPDPAAQSVPNTDGCAIIAVAPGDRRSAADEPTCALEFTDNGIAPTAANDTATTSTGVPVDIKVLDNDDSAGAPVTGFSVTQPAHGTAQTVTPLVRASADATPSHDYVTYTPDTGFAGTDHFTYSYSTANGTAMADVTVTVDAPPPTAHDDAATTKEDTAVSVDVLANDDANYNGPLHISSVGAASDGSARIDGNEIRYTPKHGFVGTDHFDYVASTAYGSSTATVTVTVDAPPPTAIDDSAKTDEDTAVTVDVLANDDANGGGALHVSSVGSASHGTATVDGNEIRYTPRSGFIGTDHFDYTAATAYGTSTATVTITVGSSGTNPVTRHKHKGGGDLADTGTDSEQLLGIAAGLLAVGGAATAGGRRRRSRGSNAG